jgi:hypothetical protein
LNDTGVIDIEQLRKQTQAGARDASGAQRDRVLGMYEGLTASGPAQMRPRPGEREMHHAGYLAGHLTGWIAANRLIDDDIVMVAAGYGAALATPEGQRALPGPVCDKLAPLPGDSSVIKSHTFAAVLTEKHRGQRLDAVVEQTCFEWLLEQSGTPPTRALLAKMKQVRERRLRRTGM